MKKKIITIVIILGIVGLGIKGKGLLESRKAEVNNEPLPSVQAVSVPVVYATEGTLKNIESYLARIASDKSIKLSTKLAGYVEKVYVEESQKVKKSEILVSIDKTELLSSIQALKSTLSTQYADAKVSQGMYNRNLKLYKIGGLSKEKLDISKVAKEAKSSIIENTKQKIAQLDHQRTYLTLVAPFDGEIDAILLHEGDLAAAGKPILSMSNGNKKMIFSYASSSSQIAKGQTVLFQSNKIGHIQSIYTTSSNGLTTAQVALNAKLNQPVGSSLNINVVTKESSGCIVPANTLLHKKEGIFLMIYKEKKFVPQKVEVQMKENEKVLISVCPSEPIAQASEVKLATLPAFNSVEILGAKDE